MKICPHCSEKDTGLIGGSYRVQALEKQRFFDIRGFNTYVCPRCGYTEFYRFKEDEGKE